MKATLEVRRQFLPLFEADKRWFCVVAHRRAGKTVAAIQRLVRDALNPKLPNSNYAFVAPQYNQAKSICWPYLTHMAVELGGAVNESELRVDFKNGSRIRLFGADNPDRLRGLRLDGIVMDEFAQMPRDLWGQVVRPALADRKGWAGVIGTPAGHNQLYELHQAAKTDPEWLALTLRADETELIDDDELRALRKSMTEEEFNQEFLCDFEAAVKGAYFGKEMKQAYFGTVPHDPALRVATSWDLGIDDSTVIWCWQKAGAQLRAINCLEFQGSSLADIVNELDRWDYRFEQHILPHDVEVRELGTGKSRREILNGLGVRSTVAPRLPVIEGIKALQLLIPRMAFDAEHCRKGYEALTLYRTDFDPKRGVFRQQPLHDWTSHFADAARYYAVTKAKPSVSHDAYDDWAIPVNI